jgi:cytochrome c oxidase subunit III
MPNMALQPEGGARATVSPSPALSGIWVVVAAITMAFAAFTSSLIIRQGSGNDWRHLAIPGILYFNTAILLLSSLTLEIARRRTAESLAATRSWLYLTLALGTAFLLGQYGAWHQLRSEGFYLATSPNSSFFYVLTVMHALHVLGGLGGFVHAVRKTASSVWRVTTLDACAVYWHFLAGLWIYLLLVLRTRL